MIKGKKFDTWKIGAIAGGMWGIFVAFVLVGLVCFGRCDVPILGGKSCLGCIILNPLFLFMVLAEGNWPIYYILHFSTPFVWAVIGAIIGNLFEKRRWKK